MRALRRPELCRGGPLDRSGYIEEGRFQAENVLVGHMVKRRAQPAVIVILKRDEAERLQHSSARLASRTQKFGHAVHRSRLGLKGNFDKIALPQRGGQLQKAASRRNGLEFSFGAPAIF